MAAGLLTVSVGRVLQTLASAEPSDRPYGRLLPPDANGIRLPAGFVSRIIARTGQVVGATGYVWHAWPDGGACFPLANGRHAYVSNSELDAGTGGVSAVVFDVNGEITDAYRICSGTTRNCAGGATPWGTWMSGEEFEFGQIYECDPTGQTPAVARPSLGTFRHEAGAVDPATGIVYLTEDEPDGRLYRFVPDASGSLASGQLYAATVDEQQHVAWVVTSVDRRDQTSQTQPFNGGEGIVVRGDTLFFATKGDKRIWSIDLATSQLDVLHDCLARPTTALNAIDNLCVDPLSGDLYVAEDGGNLELCLLAETPSGLVISPFLQFIGHDLSEVAGPAFSPDGTTLYVSSQRGSDGINGVTIAVTGPFRNRLRIDATSSIGDSPPVPRRSVTPNS